MAKHLTPTEGADHVVKAQQTLWWMIGYKSICTLAPHLTEGMGTYPGRQYSTTNLNTPCLSGALNDAE